MVCHANHRGISERIKGIEAQIDVQGNCGSFGDFCALHLYVQALLQHVNLSCIVVSRHPLSQHASSFVSCPWSLSGRKIGLCCMPACYCEAAYAWRLKLMRTPIQTTVCSSWQMHVISRAYDIASIGSGGRELTLAPAEQPAVSISDLDPMAAPSPLLACC